MVTIRKARQEEADILAEIGLRAWQKAMIPVGGTADMADNARNAFLRFTRDGWICITVIEKSGHPSGWAAREELDEAITDFWIDPDSEGQGLGTALLGAVEAEIRDAGFGEAVLETHARNQDAVDFFRARGFAVQWLSIVYNPKLDRDLETVGMRKILVPQQDDLYAPH